jgi:glycolate oxidase
MSTLEHAAHHETSLDRFGDPALNTGSAEIGAVPRDELLQRLRLCLAPHCIVEQTEAQRPFECDGLSLYRELPLVVVLPEDATQVQQVLQVCHALDVPVVARGAGTGLSGGAMPHPEGVLLALSKLDRILGIDPIARTARVQPGVTNLSISEAAAAHGLYYAPDPSSQIACSIGGNVAENSGGVHCLKYGLTVHNILSLKLQTVTGEEVQIGSRGLDSPGYDLMALLTGSEGLLGIVTEITVRLLPLPERAQVVVAGFASVSAAGDAVGAVIAAGIIPAGLEMMDRLAIQAAEDFCHAGYPRDAAAMLLCEVDGTREEVAQHVEQITQLFAAHGASSLVVSSDERQRALLWKGRKSAFPAVGRIAPDYYCMDGTIPRAQISCVLEEIYRLAVHYELAVANVFHAGDGNLHPLILFDASDPGQVLRAHALGGEILDLSVRVGGCITGEHGVGVEKLRKMPSQFSALELLQFEEIKHAFDQHLNLNPGKGIPILKRCQEYRALPVKTTVRQQPDSCEPSAHMTSRNTDAKGSDLRATPGDHSAQILDALLRARERRCPVYITAGGSKRQLAGRDCDALALDVSGHRGIVEYQPTELVITARAGTPLTVLADALAEHNQQLPFEPPLFSGKATLGGTLACNLSGPARPWRGSIRDHVLGVSLINGRCEFLKFGGKVMKNVAGYDVSRLQAGALGTLGVLCDISLRVAPLPEQTITLCYAMSATEAIDCMNRRAAEPKPLSAACWLDGQLYLRLSGAASAVQSTAAQWGGDVLTPEQAPWEGLREMSLPCFAGEAPLWRFSLQSSAPLREGFGPTLIDWGGAQRWVRGEHSWRLVQQAAAAAGGHVTLFRGGNRRAEVRTTLSVVEQRLQQRLKRAFDPDGILNPGRLYSWL